MLGLVTYVVRYRRQRNRILQVIIREGGLYLALALGNGLFFEQGTRLAEYTFLVLKLVIALTTTPNRPVSIRVVHWSYPKASVKYRFRTDQRPI